MAFTQAEVHTFDCLGNVHIAASVRQTDGLTQTSSLVLHVSTDVQGTGEDDPREWLRDALIALLETL